jgi:hypothetical protein
VFASLQLPPLPTRHEIVSRALAMLADTPSMDVLGIVGDCTIVCGTIALEPRADGVEDNGIGAAAFDVVVRNGKTGFRAANTMSVAVAAYERVRKRYPDAKAEDYIFLPQYKNRKTAAKIIQRQFNELLSRGLLGSAIRSAS